MKDIVIRKPYSKVTSLTLTNLELPTFPEEIFLCKNLRKLNLSGNKIKSIPAKIKNLSKLKVLNLSNNELSQIHAGIFNLQKLECLVISRNMIKTLPKQINKLTNLKILILQNNQLTEINMDLIPKSIVKLHLSNNLIKTLNWLQDFSLLKSLWIGNNPLNSTPDFDNLKSLRNNSLKNIYYYSAPQTNITPTFDLHSVMADSKECMTSNDKNIYVENKVNIFISYCHEDAKWLIQLQKHFRALLSIGAQFEYWDDTKINSGDDWLEEIEQNLSKSDIAILIVSTGFLASDFVQKKEVPELLKKAANKGTHIIPVIVSPCLFDKSNIKRFQSVNDPTKPLSGLSGHNRDKIFVKLMKDIDEELNSKYSL